MSDSEGWSGWFSRPVAGVLVIGALVLVLAVPIALDSRCDRRSHERA